MAEYFRDEEGQAPIKGDARENFLGVFGGVAGFPAQQKAGKMGLDE